MMEPDEYPGEQLPVMNQLVPANALVTVPRVHLSGELENVAQAVRQVRRVLAAPDERVTLKLDVSHAFHSHIIGRGGAQVQSVMRDTGAHVHFPDCNRSAGPDTPRSNFVSATGTMAAVEKARERLRELMPVVFYMDVDMSGCALSALPVPPPPATPGGGGVVASVVSTAGASCQGALAATLALAAAAQKNYGVSVRARMRGSGGGVVQLQIRGAQTDLPRMRVTCAALARELWDQGGIDPSLLQGTTQVYSIVQVSPRHQSVMLGPDSQVMFLIAENTGTQLSVPDVDDDSVPLARRGSVTITGPLDAVYMARQQLIGSLPLKLVFDIPEHMVLQNSTLMQLSNMLDVNITTFHKEKQHCTTVTVRGVERNASNLYEARRIMLGSHLAPVLASIPVSYHIPMKHVSHSTNSTGNTPLTLRAIDMFPNCPSTSNSDDSSPNVSPLKNAHPPPQIDSGISSPIVSPVKIPPRLVVPENNGLALSPMQAGPQLPMPPQGNHASIQGAASLPLLNASNNPMQDAWPDKFNGPPCAPQMFPPRTLPVAAPPSDSNFRFPKNPNQNGHLFPAIETILMFFGLEKYIGLFRNEEIDLEVFLSLNEQDLLNIGITAYGARRKLMGVINSFKKNDVTYSGSAAPGAERKPSPPDSFKKSGNNNNNNNW